MKNTSIYLVLTVWLSLTCFATPREIGTVKATKGGVYHVYHDDSFSPGILEIRNQKQRTIGYYRVIDAPSRIVKDTIIFDKYADVDGNKIVFERDPPREIELDTAQVVMQPGRPPLQEKKYIDPTVRVEPNPNLEKVARQRIKSRSWVRIVENFNLNWIFALGDENKGEEPGDISPSRWRKVTLPHDWSIEHEVHENYKTGSSGGFVKTGLGWYLKTFDIPKHWKDRRVFVEFDGVFMRSDVWLNGHWLGHRPYGFSSFRYDLTPYLKAEGNKMEVRVDNSQQRSARWYTGSGIYRDVQLIITDPVHISRHGTYVKSQTDGTVKVETRIINTALKEASVELKTSIGTVSEKSRERIKPGEEKVFVQNLKVNSPLLWSPTNPKLYTIESRLKIGSQLVDQKTTSFGFRKIEFHADKGLFVNGISTNIKGVCIHEDGGAIVGGAASVDIWERRFNILKEMGCNAVRLSHNPFFKGFYDLSDRLGILVIDEAFDEWRVGKREHTYYKYFNEWAERDLKDMIIRNRNHPSIIAWSLGNEIRDSHEKHGKKTVDWLIKITRSLDDRPITMGLNHPQKANEYGIANALDWVGYNFAHRKDTYGKERKAYPHRKIYGSETTHSFQTRGVYKTQTFRNNTKQQPHLTKKEIFNFDYNYRSSYDTAFVEHHNRFTLKYDRDNEWMAGEFRWTGIDYLGESGPWPSRYKDFGIIDMCGFPKDTYYLYQSVWSDTTVLHVLPHWNWPGMDGVEIPVWIYANNCDQVELFQDGKSLGRKRFKDDELYANWMVTYRPGEIKALSYRGGKVVKERIIQTTGKPAQIELTLDKKNIDANGRDMVHARVRILDAQGRFVPNSSNRVNFKVEGPAEYLGADNGDPLDHDLGSSNHRKVFHGMALGLIQSGFDQGTVTIQVSSEGLKGAQTQFSIKGKAPVIFHQSSTPAGLSRKISQFEKDLNIPKAAPVDYRAKKKPVKKKK
ncbi:MAG: DUF4982 domain-containing protein [Planctomycetes bacterium]|nr:DUF4982 domain-containing protein [Planctomycetota bacterium]